MNNFLKLKKISNVLFGKIQDYLFVTEFQSAGLVCDHGLLWVQNALQFGISSNEIIEFFFDKYLTIDQTIFPVEICSTQIRQHK
jgi:hypothetical protein